MDSVPNLVTSKPPWKPREQRNTVDISIVANTNTVTRWKPQQQRGKDDIPMMNLINKIRLLLNKVTQRTLSQVVDQLFSYDIYSDLEQLEEIADLFIEKCFNGPEFCALYTKVIFEIFQRELNNGARLRFVILVKTQRLFDADTHRNTKHCIDFRRLVCMEKEQNPRIRDILLAEKQKTHERRSRALYVLLANLCLIGFLTEKIMHSIFSECFTWIYSNDIDDVRKLTKIKDLSIINGLQIIKVTGANSYVWMPRSRLEKRLEDLKNGRCARTRFAIQDVLDLIKNDFVPRASAINI